jgi:hypothetical protein
MRRSTQRRMILAGMFVFASVEGLLCHAQEQPIQVPATRVGLRPSLSHDRVPAFPRRPFEWGRRQEFHTRHAVGRCGVPVAQYDRQIPLVTASAISRFPAALERFRGPSVSSETALAKQPSDPLAIATTVPPAPDVRQRKRFELDVRQLSASSFLLDQIGVAVYDNGRIAASGQLFHSGGQTGAERGGEVDVRVIGYGAADASGLTGGAVVLWETAVREWVPRGGPKTVSLIDPGRQTEIRSLVAETFEELTHVEVMIEPRIIR